MNPAPFHDILAEALSWIRTLLSSRDEKENERARENKIKYKGRVG